MKPLIIAKTIKTPEVLLDNTKGIIEIKGRSIHEDTYSYFNPLMKWIEEYKENPKKVTTVNIHLEYFNSSSARYLMDLIKSLEPIQESGKKVSVNWLYDPEDEDMKDEIELLESLTSLKFHKQEDISLIKY